MSNKMESRSITKCVRGSKLEMEVILFILISIITFQGTHLKAQEAICITIRSHRCIINRVESTLLRTCIKHLCQGVLISILHTYSTSNMEVNAIWAHLRTTSISTSIRRSPNKLSSSSQMEMVLVDALLQLHRYTTIPLRLWQVMQCPLMPLAMPRILITCSITEAVFQVQLIITCKVQDSSLLSTFLFTAKTMLTSKIRRNSTWVSLPTTITRIRSHHLM